MISRTLKWTLGTGVALLSPLAAAVGLGELQLRSAMEERFAAEIELLQIGDLNEHQMAVNLAPAEDFERAGMERDFQLADLRFQVDLSTPGRPVVKVSSRRPIREPYLNFLVELRWPSGRLLREYTTLLDLPTFAGEPAVGKTSAATPTVAADRSSPAPAPHPAASPGAVGVTHGAPASGRIQVREGDTLWAIARRHQIPGASIHQVMQAIVAANPDAFIGGDINLIRRDAWLRIPDAAAMRVADGGRMAATLQNPPVEPPAIESGPSGQAATPAAQPDGELRLTNAADGATAENSAAGTETADAGTTPGADISLAGALEERDRLQRENDDLRNRVKNLEAQLQVASRLVELEAPELAALQEQSAATQADGTEATASTPPPEETAPVAGPAGEPADAAALEPPAEPTQAAASAEPQPQAPPVAEPPATAPPSPDQETSPGAALAALGGWLIPALGVTAALLLGLLVIAARRRSSGVQQRGLTLPSDLDLPHAGALDTQAPTAFDSADEFFAEPPPVDEVTSLLNEADVCLSLGHEEQAEEVVRDGLGKYPEDARLHLKLLETLAARGDRDGFETHLPRLAALGDLEAFASAQALQSQLAAPDQFGESAQRDGGSLAASDELPLEEFDLGLDLDLDEPAGEAPPRQSPAVAAAPRAADLEDFDLGLEQMAAQAEVSDAAIPEPAFEDLQVFEPGQEVATQLELARAYVDMGDTEGAREILEHVIEAGDAEQQQVARQLRERLG